MIRSTSTTALEPSGTLGLMHCAAYHPPVTLTIILTTLTIILTLSILTLVLIITLNLR